MKFKQQKFDITHNGKTIQKNGFRLNLDIFAFYIDLLFVDEITNLEYAAGAVFHDKRSYKALVEFCWQPDTNTIIHESTHLAQAICLDIADDNKDSIIKDELMAYLTGYISEKIFNLIDKEIDKKMATAHKKKRKKTKINKKGKK